MALSTLQARTGAMIAGTRLQSARSLRAALPAVRGAALGARKQRRAHAGVVRAALIQSDIERERSRSFRRTVRRLDAPLPPDLWRARAPRGSRTAVQAGAPANHARARRMPIWRPHAEA